MFRSSAGLALLARILPPRFGGFLGDGGSLTSSEIFGSGQSAFSSSQFAECHGRLVLERLLFRLANSNGAVGALCGFPHSLAIDIAYALKHSYHKSDLLVDWTCPLLMPALQLVHIEEVGLDGRTYTIAVVRVAGGLAGQWYCPCGEARMLPGGQLTVDHALRDARLDLERHHLSSHTDQGASPS
jgi:hypothetical protein